MPGALRAAFALGQKPMRVYAQLSSSLEEATMRFFGNRTNEQPQEEEKRSEPWPLDNPHSRYVQQPDPKDFPDKVPTLKRRIAEIDSLYPEDRQVADPMLETRSPEFAPLRPGLLQPDDVGYSRRWMVETVFRKRSAAIPEVDARAPLGKLLVFDANETLCDGVCAVVSEGYFDSADEPGWNTWIDYDDGGRLGDSVVRLLCYVPPQLIELVDSAIDCNAVECHHWIDCPELIPPS